MGKREALETATLMAPLPETSFSGVRPSPSPHDPSSSASSSLSSPFLRCLLALGALVVLVLASATDSAAWGDNALSLGMWAPAVGFGLVLVAWFGSRAAALVLAAGLLTVLQTALVGFFFPNLFDARRLGLAAGDAVLTTALVLTAWWAYRRFGGARSLVIPAPPCYS